jgi:hypothetical protein
MVVAVALTIAISGACGCKRSELDTFHSKWTKLPLSPLADSVYLQQAESSPCAWSVQASGDRITIGRVSGRSIQPADEVRLQFVGGTLVGENRGEWGGRLSVLEGSNRTRREILTKSVLHMFPTRDGVEVITGDLAANEGSVWLYSKSEGKDWLIQKKSDLHGYPKVAATSGERILLAYGDSVSIMENFNERQLAALPFMGARLNSIAQDAKGDIYVGMNAFVVRLVSDRNGYSQQWFTQRGCLR